MNFASKLATASVVALMAGAVGASAASLTINSVTGAWSDAVPTSGVTIDNTGGTGVAVTARWGTPATSGGQQSGYDFTGAAPPAFVANEATDFNLGTFVHQNWPIFAPSLSSITLDVTINVQDYGDITSQFLFTHEETTNTAGTCAYPSTTPCADKVTAVLNVGSSDSFNIAGVDYVFNISGFETGLGPLDYFITQEGGANQAYLVGSFVTKASVVPLPAAGWLLIAGLGGLAAIRRKQKSA